jgi:hypothetical protein
VERFCLHCGMGIPLEAWVCPFCTRELQPGSGFVIWCTAKEKRQYEAEQVAGFLGGIAAITVVGVVGFPILPSLILGAVCYVVIAVVVYAILA